MGLPEYAVDDLRRKADELAGDYLGSPGRVGLAVGALIGGERFYFGYGAAAKGSDRVPDEHTVFEIGSVTKVFTAVLMEEMAGRGEVRPDQPVRELLPPGTAVPKHGDRAVTLCDLATHTAGLPRMPGNWQEGMKDEANPYADYTPDHLYRALAATRQRWKPGTRADYSNYGVGLLGHALELRAGRPYEQLLAERVLNPLGLADTAVDLSDDQRRRMAGGHDEEGNPTSNWDIRTLGGAGALRSTVAEMLTFLRAILEPAATPLKEALAACHVTQPLPWRIGAATLTALVLVAVGLLVQWVVPVPPGSWTFLAVFALPVLAAYFWGGFWSGAMASVAVWAATLAVWGPDRFGWQPAGIFLLILAAGAYGVRRLGGGGDSLVMPGWQPYWFGDALGRWHNGGTGGYRSFVGFVADSRVAVAVLSNSAHDVDSIGVDLLQHLHEANKVWATVPRTFRGRAKVNQDG
jgi:CubicO group peptidase (beta-lactamase class C family)